MRRLTILGSTGSVGVNCLNLIEETQSKGNELTIEALTAGKNAPLLSEQAKRHRPNLSVIADEAAWPEFKSLMQGTGLEIASGAQAVVEAASRRVDWVLAAIVGIAGLRPTWAAAATGAVLALANKESLVCCGRALIERSNHYGGVILPVDSEHNAIFQVLNNKAIDKVKRLILTASGGPFRGFSSQDLANVTLKDALKHPNWTMGPKITIDSASLANKGLEWIEAAYFFGLEAIDVVVHPQSIIHSLVEYKDGSSLAQMGCADMRIPIAYCLAYPDRMNWNAPGLDLLKIGRLDFEKPDEHAFPMLGLARQAYHYGKGLPVVYNSANEVAVSAFLEQKIGFIDIARIVEIAMQAAIKGTIAGSDLISPHSDMKTIEAVMDLDKEIRSFVESLLRARHLSGALA